MAKFNRWYEDTDAQQWLYIMGYPIDDIENVQAFKLHGYKTDVQVQIVIKLKNIADVENIQVKLVSNVKGFNQIDKRKVDSYISLWNIPPNVVHLLKLYTGEEKPTVQNTKYHNRLLANEFSEQERSILLNWLKLNRSLIILDVLKGRGKFSAEWMLVIQKLPHLYHWVLKPINVCINHFGKGDIVITPRGNIKIGKITMQRKGGDKGRPSACMLQFKINPAELFMI